MINYEFGDIIDCRKVEYCFHSHFIIIFGLAGKDKILYSVITSQIYRAFDMLCDFFNDYCIGNKCSRKHFYNKFQNKRNKDKEIKPVNLSDVFFLDKKNYLGCLDKDSMIIINRDLDTIDLSVLNEYKKEKRINHASRLSNQDMFRLYEHLTTSKHISRYNLNYIGKSFNKCKKEQKLNK